MLKLRYIVLIHAVMKIVFVMMYMYVYLVKEVCAYNDFTNMIAVCTGVQALAKPITAATIELYQRIVRDLPPTPSKFHYIFNLRDLSRIYHGLFTTIPERFEETGLFVRVWRNECLRVFYDRLTNDKDRTIVSEHISELLNQYFQEQTEVHIRIYRHATLNCILVYVYVYVALPTLYSGWVLMELASY